jgi:hypothetical protein
MNQEHLMKFRLRQMESKSKKGENKWRIIGRIISSICKMMIVGIGEKFSLKRSKNPD